MCKTTILQICGGSEDKMLFTEVEEQEQALQRRCLQQASWGIRGPLAWRWLTSDHQRGGVFSPESQYKKGTMCVNIGPTRYIL